MWWDLMRTWSKDFCQMLNFLVPKVFSVKMDALSKNSRDFTLWSGSNPDRNRSALQVPQANVRKKKLVTKKIF